MMSCPTIMSYTPKVSVTCMFHSMSLSECNLGMVNCALDFLLVTIFPSGVVHTVLLVLEVCVWRFFASAMVTMVSEPPLSCNACIVVGFGLPSQVLKRTKTKGCKSARAIPTLYRLLVLGTLRLWMDFANEWASRHWSRLSYVSVSTLRVREHVDSQDDNNNSKIYSTYG